jgi:hypothetical protein
MPLVHILVSFVVEHLGVVLASLVAAALARFAFRRWITTAERARWLELACERVLAALAPAVRGTATKADDVALAVVAEVERLAEAEGKRLSEQERARAQFVARQRLAEQAAAAIVLAPIQAAAKADAEPNP